MNSSMEGGAVFEATIDVAQRWQIEGDAAREFLEAHGYADAIGRATRR